MTSLVISENVLKIYLIAYFFVLVNFVFVATFVIKIKKRERKVRQTDQISHTGVNRAVCYSCGSNCPYPRALAPPPPPRIFLMAPNAINIGGSNK